MHGALKRKKLAEAAAAVMAASGAASARATALRVAMGGGGETITFADLLAVPWWVRLDAGGRAQLARLAALATLAPRIGRTVDGRVLGAFEAAAGGAALDWAIGLGEGIAFAAPLKKAPDLDALGARLLAATLPEALRAYLLPGVAFADPARAARALKLAREAFEPESAT